MTEWHYSYFGLKISSTLELPEWLDFAHVFDDIPDVEIRACTLEQQTVITSAESSSVDDYCLALPRIGQYRVTGGKSIEVHYLPDADSRKIRFFLMGSVWGALCYQRGMLALHAGAVQIGGEAVLLCAKQGGGKSTLTASLALRGYPLISDDLCCLTFTEASRPAILPSTRRLRLWGDALDALGLNKDFYERDFFRIDKYLVPWSGNHSSEPVPLKSIYLLEWGDPGIERIFGAQALERFIGASIYRPDILQQVGNTGAYWEDCLKLLDKMPVYVLTRPKNMATLPYATDLALRHHS